jgi:apolipoprotein N-acyltransferase
MLVPAWDFYRDAWMASSVAALRGVESGYSVVRAGRESYLNVSDRYGHTLARQRSDYLPGSSVLVDLPLGPATPTLHARYGNAFGWLSVAASAVMIVLAARAGNQPKPATANALAEFLTREGKGGLAAHDFQLSTFDCRLLQARR